MRLYQYIKSIALSAIVAAVSFACSEDDVEGHDIYQFEYQSTVSNITASGADVSIKIDEFIFNHITESEIVSSGVIVIKNDYSPCGKFYYAEKPGLDYTMKLTGLSPHTEYSLEAFVKTEKHTYVSNGSHLFTTIYYHEEYESVDLGLSVKWCNKNLGADYARGLGGFYHWGETKPVGLDKKEYNNIDWKNLSDDDLISKGYIDNNLVLTPEYDAATQTLGNGWRTPTHGEINELIKNCKFSRTGNALKVTGPNGNSIYLPMNGDYSLDNDKRINVNERALLLTSTRLFYALFEDGFRDYAKTSGHYGYEIRPVKAY